LLSVVSVPATPRTPGVAAGYCTQPQFELPAAATTPFERAQETALAIVDEELGPAQLRFSTRAPWSAAHVMPDAMAESEAPEAVPTWTA
jgi:hypothetical protein